MPDAYKQSGVDIEAADRLIDQIKPMAASTRRKEVLGGIGGFGGLFAVPKGYEEPILVSGTDGVGTKLLVAQAMEHHTTIGIDLVAMCVNDILVVGAEPLFFLDYFATGALNPTAAAEVVSGVAEGCRQAGCTLLGGETAEMPGMYAPGHYDLAGFTVGVAEKAALPDPQSIRPGDVLIALPSNGLHSNGFSLVRRVLEGLDWDSPFGDRTLGEVVLAPTRIYVKELLPLFRAGRVKGAAHITGGGLPGNIPRMLPDGLGAVLDPWPLPPIFQLLQTRGELSDADMQQTFNLGIGMVLAVARDHVDAVLEQTDGWTLGEVVSGEGVSLR